MKRRTAHALFGAGALGLGLLVTAQAWQLRACDRIALAVQQASASAPAPAPAPAPPQARLAHALALAAAGNYDAAATAYKELAGAAESSAAQGEEAAPGSDSFALRQVALYDLGNLSLRAALGAGPQEAIRSLPLIELAKHCYREVLHADPQDWDARYNLERALWLAPEFDSGDDAVDRPSGPRERAATTMQGSQGDLP